MTSPRVLFVAAALGRGGAEKQVVLSAGALQAMLHVSAPPLHMREFARDRNVVLDVPSADASDRSPPASSSRPSYLEQLSRLRRCLLEYAPDVVVTFLGSAALRYELVSLLRGLRARGLSPSRPAPRWILAERGLSLHGGRRWRPSAAAHAVGYRFADAFVANSEVIASGLFQQGASLSKPVFLIPNIIESLSTETRTRLSDLPGVQNAKNAKLGRPLLGLVGSFQRERNHMLLADSLPLILRDHPEATVVLMGRTDTPECIANYTSFCARLEANRVRDRVVILGEVSQASTWMNQFDVVLSTSAMEGSSNAVAEAIERGCVVAATPAGDSSAIVRNAGVVSRGWSARLFADAVIEAIARRDELAALVPVRRAELLHERSPARVGMLWRSAVEQVMEGRR